MADSQPQLIGDEAVRRLRARRNGGRGMFPNLMCMCVVNVNYAFINFAGNVSCVLIDALLSSRRKLSSCINACTRRGPLN